MMKLLTALCFAAAGIMFAVGSNDGKLTELKDFFWVPLIPGLVFGFLTIKGKKNP